MSFKLNCTTQSSRFFEGVKETMYEKVNHASKKSRLMRLAGPIVAMSSAVLTLAMRVAAVGEALIKGLANIFGSPFSKKCNVLKGLKQIFIQAPNYLCSLALSPLEIGVGGLVTIGGMLVKPEEYSKSRADVHSQTIQAYKNVSSKSFSPSNIREKLDALLLA